MAQNNLGYFYFSVESIRDYEKALYWLKKSAEQHVALAQITLGTMYEQGLGVTRDFAQARAWYEKAAMQNNPQAQFRIGLLYANGQGVTQSFDAALEWLHKAEAQGDMQARNAITQIEQIKAKAQ